MHLWEGIVYKDDRLFILDLTPAKKDGKSVWAAVTRRNCEGFPTFRIDDFKTKEEAIIYIRKIEPTTLLISLGGKSPEIPPTESFSEFDLRWVALLLLQPLEAIKNGLLSKQYNAAC